MVTFFITSAILLLVLLLTGVLGAVLVVGLQIIGWLVVAVLVIALLTHLFELPLRRANSLRKQRALNERIKWKHSLGYDTADLKNELAALKAESDYSATYRGRFLRRQVKRRRKLGYGDSNQHEA
jgi:hypothetical protein